MRRGPVSGLVVSIIGFAFVAAFAVPASANYFGYGPGCCRYADNANHGFNQASTVSYNFAALDYARGVLANETAMTTFYDATEDPTTDLVAFDQYYTTYWNVDWDGSTTGSNVLGVTRCVDTTVGGECERNEMRLDLADTDSMTTSQRRWLVLHEMGHSVGLDHSTISDSFMRTAGPHSLIHFNTHDKNHINSRWG